ncbi:MAG: 2-isopropylmalate synthase [Vampirovibrionales bacterium]
MQAESHVVNAPVNPANHVKIFDTTLRDGEQSAGVGFTKLEKLQVAQQLAILGVDVIEAGFPFSSPEDFESVQLIANTVQGPSICALSRAIKADIATAWDAIKGNRKPRIHTFIATSDIHIQAKFKKTREDILAIAREHVAYARQLCNDVEFSAEDAGRTEPAYLYAVLEAVIEAGATTVNIPDTVGYMMPEEFGRLIAGIKANVRNIDQAIISVHCHNDLGLAVGNSLMGTMNGARQLECTINGLGERAGNAALEELVMALEVRQAYFEGLYTSIVPEHLYETSQLISTLTGIPVQPNKAIVGENAFAHVSGIHQDGFLKGRETYEILRPERVGQVHSRLPLGPRAGRAAVKSKMAEMGVQLEGEALDSFFKAFKSLADAQKRVSHNDLEALHTQWHQTYAPAAQQALCSASLS